MIIDNEWGKEKGANYLTLGVENFNEDAIKFYEKARLETKSRRMDMKI